MSFLHMHKSRTFLIVVSSERSTRRYSYAHDAQKSDRGSWRSARHSNAAQRACWRQGRVCVFISYCTLLARPASARAFGKPVCLTNSPSYWRQREPQPTSRAPTHHRRWHRTPTRSFGGMRAASLRVSPTRWLRSRWIGRCSADCAKKQGLRRIGPAFGCMAAVMTSSTTTSLYEKRRLEL